MRLLILLTEIVLSYLDMLFAFHPSPWERVLPQPLRKVQDFL